MLRANRTIEGNLESVVIELLRGRISEGEIQTLRNSDWTCDHCQAAMLVKMGDKRRWHFAHRASNERCPYVIEHGGESREHEALKLAILEAALEELGVSAKVEVPLLEANRRADVLVECDGIRVAYECQLSVISLHELQTRTLAYESVGIEVVWVFERSVMTTQSRLHEHYRWLLTSGREVVLAELKSELVREPFRVGLR